MAFVGFFKSEKNPAGLAKGWTWLDTTINAPVDLLQHQCNGSVHYRREAAGAGANIYCHDEAAPEPIADGEIRTSIFDASEVEYSGPAGVIHSFTSSGSFFTSDQDLNIDGDWTIYYNAKATGTPVDNTATITFAFYKRDTDDNDTFLWNKTVLGIGTFYGFAGSTVVTTPVGSVTTDDRLRVRVSMDFQPV